MNEITLHLATKDITTQVGVTGNDLLDLFDAKPISIIGIKLNNELISLNDPITINGTVEPVFINTRDGASIYRRSLCFVLAAAAKRLYPERQLVVGHSLGYGYYYTIQGNKNLSAAEISALQTEMDKIVDQSLPIETKTISFADAMSLFKSLGLAATCKQLLHDSRSKVKINTLGDFSDLYFDPLVRDTSYLRVFELTPYEDGFLLRFPAHMDHDKLTPFSDNPKIFTIYKKYKEWGARVGVTTAADLNEMIARRRINDFIDITETFQQQNMSEIAQQIKARGNVRVVLIAGPSSSGKTTTAKKMSLQLQALGYNPKVISLDCYYVGREKNPKDENGNYDYECLEALDIELLNQNLIDLFAGKEVEIPAYNFDLGQRYYAGDKMQLAPQDILVMEGIHGLNDKLTPLIPNEYKFKMYISALTQLNLDEHNRIATSDNRLVRRIVRDSRYRGKSAAETISMWESVQKGERLHIFPFQNNADAVLNTALDYELPVLRVYAEPLLRCVHPDQAEYTEARRLLRFLRYFSTVSASNVPTQSILREFIGGSSFHY